MAHAFSILDGAFHRSTGVGDIGAVEAVEKSLGVRLPAGYKAFLMWSDGGETAEPLPRLRFYQLEELLPRCDDGQPPDLLEFATDDDDGFAFDLLVDRGGANYPIVRYPLGDITRDDVELAGPGFRTFLEWWVDPAARYRRTRP